MAKKKTAKKSAKKTAKKTAKKAVKKTAKKKTKATKKTKSTSVAKRPAKKVAKTALRAKTEAGSGSGGLPRAVVTGLTPKKFKFKKKEPDVTITGTGFTNGVVTFSTTTPDKVTWTKDPPSSVTPGEVVLDAKPEKGSKSKTGRKGRETGDLTVTVDSSHPVTFEVDFEPEDL